MRQRIRTFKQECFQDEELFDAEQESGVPLFQAWFGLISIADREGRFKWLPRRMKNFIMPYHSLNFEDVLNVLWKNGFIQKYTNGDKTYGYIPTFTTHQVINKREPESTIPPIDDEKSSVIDYDTQQPSEKVLCTHVHAPEVPWGKGTGKGKGKGRNLCATLQSSDSLTVVSIPLIDSTEHHVTEADVEEYTKTYPAVDVKEQLLLIRAWNRDNPRNRKTQKGIARHIGMWLADKQNKARRAVTQQITQTTAQAKPCAFKGCDKESMGEWNRVPFCAAPLHKEWAKNQ